MVFHLVHQVASDESAGQVVGHFAWAADCLESCQAPDRGFLSASVATEQPDAALQALRPQDARQKVVHQRSVQGAAAS